MDVQRGGGSFPVRWIGIDEAGYGPNLGPLVMTSVTAQSQETAPGGEASCQTAPPDLWRDLAATVDRAGGDASRLWIDDSKAILRGGKGRDRLESTCLALLEATGQGVPADLSGLLATLRAGTWEESELSRWLDSVEDLPRWPSSDPARGANREVVHRPLEPHDRSWQIVAVRTVVYGPERFNRLLDATGSKARVHFAAFRELLRDAWALAADGVPTAVQSDKHGGRHYYLEPLVEAFPETWIERGVEGPELSRYHFRQAGRAMTLSLQPRADGSDGLVALASIMSKTVRELWMDAFNAFWARRVPGLRPTAGYPVDAERFRLAIESAALGLEVHPDVWWRRR
jgi:hypothetical protein